MLAREFEAAGDTVLVPAFVVHPNHGPACPIGILKLMKGGPLKRQLHGDRMLIQKPPDGVMVGVVAKPTLDDPHNFSIIDRRIKLLKIQDVGGDRVGKLMCFAAGFGSTLVEQAEHTLLDKPPCLVADSGAIEFGLLTSPSDRFGKQDDGTNDFVVVLQRIGKEQLQLVKIIGGMRGHGLSRTSLVA